MPHVCGRYVLMEHAVPIAEQFGLTDPVTFTPRYNLAPTDEGVVVRKTPSGRKAQPMRWGLVPFWSKDPSGGAKLINARSETIGEKRAFREAFSRRRCLVPMSGFYEWKREGAKKQPYFIHAKDGSYLAAAGVYERWSDGTAALETFSVLTTASNEAISALHDRMPAFLDPDDYESWLAEPTPVAKLRP
ncbi:MAG: SOS response-associated peptidase, partial [Deltaproteobacteria bacterium]|nr:SOS response-associated peptidase [Deltaproteobacteria bacterium]